MKLVLPISTTNIMSINVVLAGPLFIQNPEAGFYTLHAIFCSNLTITALLINPFNVAVMETDGFELLKENCPLLQSELLKTVAGSEEELSGGGKSQSVWAQFSDGGNSNDRRARQQTLQNGERGQRIWVQSLDGSDARGMSPGHEG